jgi:hypothetical protein
VSDHGNGNDNVKDLESLDDSDDMNDLIMDDDGKGEIEDNQEESPIVEDTYHTAHRS